jgi:tetratricopeptide (TPR) repeat protein
MRSLLRHRQPLFAGAILLVASLLAREVRSQPAASVPDLMTQAAALGAHGDLAQALETYNEVLRAAPQHAAAYRQRALILSRMGDRAAAQADYNRFLQLEPHMRAPIDQEIQLYQQASHSTYAEAIEQPTALARKTASSHGAYATGVTPQTIAPAPAVPITDPIAAEALANARASRLVERPSSGELILATGYYASAREAFRHEAYGDVLRLGRLADASSPLAANRALVSQALLAVGSYNSAATEARAAAGSGPLTTWQTLMDYYNYDVVHYRDHLRGLEQYVRDYPSSSPAHFLLGYQYLIAGQGERAQDQLAIALVLNPSDLVAKRLLEREGVSVSGASVSRAPTASTENRPAPPAKLVR